MAKATLEVANASIQFQGCFGFTNENDVERKFRGTPLYPVALISTNLVLKFMTELVLGLPRSF